MTSRSKLKKAFVLLSALLVLSGCVLWVKGYCEIDWMINSFRQWDAVPNDYEWWFSNNEKADWHDHYINSMNMLIIGVAAVYFGVTNLVSIAIKEALE